MSITVIYFCGKSKSESLRNASGASHYLNVQYNIISKVIVIFIEFSIRTFVKWFWLVSDFLYTFMCTRMCREDGNYPSKENLEDLNKINHCEKLLPNSYQNGISIATMLFYLVDICYNGVYFIWNWFQFGLYLCQL